MNTEMHLGVSNKSRWLPGTAIAMDIVVDVITLICNIVIVRI